MWHLHRSIKPCSLPRCVVAFGRRSHVELPEERPIQTPDPWKTGCRTCNGLTHLPQIWANIRGAGPLAADSPAKISPETEHCSQTVIHVRNGYWGLNTTTSASGGDKADLEISSERTWGSLSPPETVRLLSIGRERRVWRSECHSNGAASDAWCSDRSRLVDTFFTEGLLWEPHLYRQAGSFPRGFLWGSSIVWGGLRSCFDVGKVLAEEAFFCRASVL